MRLLLVDDEEMLLDTLKRGLVAEGFAVDTSTNGLEGLELAKSTPYDCIVLDIMLPGMNGFKFTATLRQEQIWTPILMLTAKDGELDEAEAPRKRAADVPGEVARVDRQAVASHARPWVEAHEPEGLGRCSVERRPNVHAEVCREDRELIDEGDVDVAESVLDELGELGLSGARHGHGPVHQ
jgi:CheY-like chemotaxis protein